MSGTAVLLIAHYTRTMGMTWPSGTVQVRDVGMGDLGVGLVKRFRFLRYSLFGGFCLTPGVAHLGDIGQGVGLVRRFRYSLFGGFSLSPDGGLV